MSKRTVLTGRKILGWTHRGSAYGQLIRDVNKQKCLQWALAHVNDEFHNVIWTDETTVQMESHHRFCCQKGVRNLITNLDPCIQQRSMSGQESKAHVSPCFQFFSRTGSTGGGHPSKVLMPIQLRTLGTNLR